jgi:hypothetical protein
LRKNKEKVKVPRNAFEREIIKGDLLKFYESETFELLIPQTYTPDLVIPLNDGRLRVIELKGYLRRDSQLKLRYLKEQHPIVAEVCVVFQDPNDHPQHLSSMTNAQWASKHGIKWSDRVIKPEWLRREA